MKRSQLLEALVAKMTVEGKALDTVKAYRNAVNKYCLYLLATPELARQPHARRMEAYLTHRVQDDDISPSTQNVEFNALIYLHRQVLGVEIKGVNSLRAKPKLRIPPILTPEQVGTLLAALPARHALIARLLYGAGLRLNECLRLRLKDVDFSHDKLIVHEAKGDKERILPLPAVLRADLEAQRLAALESWRVDSANSHGVALPRALEKKYKSHWLSKDWYWLFPNERLGVDPRTKRLGRHHVYDFAVQKAFSEARRALDLPVYATPHALRHAFATHLTQDMLAKGFPREMIETKLLEYMGHSSKETLKWYVNLASPQESLIALPIESLGLPATLGQER